MRRGRGQGSGNDAGMRRYAGKSRGRGGMVSTGRGGGPGGDCICPNCGEKVVHTQGVPCYSVVCSKCGSKMTREYL